MRFEHVNSYPAPAEEVLAMLTDPVFRERVCEAQHAIDPSVDVVGSGAGATVEIARSQSMAGAPAVATRVVGDTVRIVQRETWTGPDTADLTIDIPGKPGEMRGGIRLSPRADGGCDEVFTGEVKVKVPLVGGKLEGLIEQILVKALVREGRVGLAWLAERAG
jgi:hypothetical protein